MITLATLREFISGMPDDTKMGIDDDQISLAIQQDRLFNKKVLTSQIRQKADASGLKL